MKKKIMKSGKKKIHFVARQGHLETYDERKVYASCYSACLGTHLTKKEAESICEEVSKAVTKWVDGKKQVTSDDIFQKVVETLKKHHEDAAFMYETHRDIS